MSIRLTPEQVQAALLAMGIRPCAEVLAEIHARPVIPSKARTPFPILLPMAREHGGGRWEIHLPGFRPTSVSTLMHVHWRVAHRIKRKEAVHIALALQAAGVTGALGKRRLRMTITLGPRQRKFDTDNAWKSMADGVKRSRALRDDSPKWCEHPDPLYERDKRQGTRLLLEDI